MRHVLRRSSPWIGSAVVHAAALILFTWWIFVAPGSPGPVSLHLGDAYEAAPPVLLESDDVELAAVELVEPRAVLDAAQEPLELADPVSLAAKGRRGEGHTLDAEFASMISGRRGSSVEFFGTIAHGNKVVFILDISGSMDENAYAGSGGRVTRFERAREELVRTISQLYAEQEFVVLLFSDSCLPMFNTPRHKVSFLGATPPNKERVSEWLAGIRPGGATDPRQSLQTALALYPDAIFLLSDGEFRIGRVGRIGDKVIRMARGLNTRRIPIHTIAYQDQRSRHTLEAIADESNGTFRFVE
jgi:hypothetical protein